MTVAPEPVDAQNAEFWNEPCGTVAATQLDFDLATQVGRTAFDQWYWSYYPYLRGYVDRCVQPGDRVVEVGLGSGTVSRYLASRAETYVGVDVAPGSCALVESSFTDLPPGDRRLLNESILHCSLPAGSFDAAVAVGSLHHTGNLPAALHGLETLVRPGGRVLLMVYNEFFWQRVLARPRRSVVRMVGNLGASTDPWDEADADLRGRNDTSVTGLSAPHTSYTSVRRLRKMSRLADYQVTRENNLSEGLQLGLYVNSRRVGLAWTREDLLGRPARLAGSDLYAEGVRRSAGAQG